MVGKARMLSALVAAIAATLAVASPATALDIRVRAEINKPDILHGFVDRTQTSLDPSGPELTDPANAATCKPDSPIAALQKVIGPASLSFANSTTDATKQVVTRIRNVPTPAQATSAHWEIYVAGKRETNPCRSLVAPDEVNTEVLAYLKCDTTTPGSTPCYRGTPLILRTLNNAPWQIEPELTNISLPVYVYRADESGGRPPSTTAQVSTDEPYQPVPVDPKFQDGSARVRFYTKGEHTVVVTDAGSGGITHVPDRFAACVTETNDGFCGQPKVDLNPFDVAEFASACDTNGHDGFCGTPDTSGPVAHVTNIKDKQVFKTKKGPGQVKGTMDVDPNGVGGVRLRLSRVSVARVAIKTKKKKTSTKKAKKSAFASATKKKKKARTRYRKVNRCTVWNDVTALLETAKCGKVTTARWFDASLSDLRYEFSYSFAMTMPAGSYVLEVEARDENGSKDAPAAGRNVLKFTVK